MLEERRSCSKNNARKVTQRTTNSKEILILRDSLMRRNSITERLMDKGDFNRLQELIDKHLAEKKCQDVFLFVTNLLPKADDFLLKMKDKVDSLVQNNERICSLLHWAEEKTHLTKTLYYPPTFYRILYLYWGLEIEYFMESFILGPDFWEHTLEVFNILNIFNDVCPTNGPNLFPPLPALENLLFFALIRACSNDHGYSWQIDDFELNPPISSDSTSYSQYHLYYLKPTSLLTLAHNLAIDTGEKTLAQTLQELKDKIPSKEDSDGIWLEWVKELKQSMITYKHFGDNFNIGLPEKKLLHSYFTSNRLLLECLRIKPNISESTQNKIINEFLIVKELN